MAFFDDLKQRWERLAERERRLLELLGLTFVLCVFGVVGFFIYRGLDEIETRNEEVREALRLLDERRDEYLEQRGQQETSVVAMIGDEAVPMATYLEGIANDVGVDISEQAEQSPQQKGRFEEVSVEIKLKREGINIQQLADFLRLIETRSPLVVTQRVHVRPFFNQHEKLDVEVTVATYRKARKTDKDKK